MNRADSMMRWFRRKDRRPEEPPQPPPPRGLLVVRFDEHSNHIDGSIVVAHGSAFHTTIEVKKSFRREAPPETAEQYREIQFGRRIEPDAMALLGRRLSQAIAMLIQNMTARSGAPEEKPVVVGLFDPGFWFLHEERTRLYQPICDPAVVAAATGLNVVDAFAARDVAQGGRGGPLDALPLWLLLRDAAGPPAPQLVPVPEEIHEEPEEKNTHRLRVLVCLDRTVRLYTLPAEDHPDEIPSGLRAIDVSPGLTLLEDVRQWGEQHNAAVDPRRGDDDPGRSIGPLLQAWQGHPFWKTHPVWSPHPVSIQPLLRDLPGTIAADRLDPRDLQCTVATLIAKRIAEALRARLPKTARVGEMILAGPGRDDGLLMRQIKLELPHLRLLSLSQCGWTDEQLAPAAMGLLTLLHIDQVPAGVPSVTGADTARILGRLTPGSPAAWHRLLEQLAAHRPEIMTLRNAI